MTQAVQRQKNDLQKLVPQKIKQAAVVKSLQKKIFKIPTMVKKSKSKEVFILEILLNNRIFSSSH